MNELREWVSDDLHDADGAYPMHPDVAALIVDIYRDRVDDEDADAMCNLGALYYIGRAGKQDYEKAAFYYIAISSIIRYFKHFKRYQDKKTLVLCLKSSKSLTNL